MAKPVSQLILEPATGRRVVIEHAAGGEARVVESARLERVDRVVALVPADRCSLLHVELPELSGRRLLEALRWAIEDQIAGDPELQHVVPLGRDAGGRMRCLVVARADMQHWCAAVPVERSAQLLPDAACLPLIEGALVLLELDGQVLARWGQWRFDRFDRALLDVLVAEMLAECADPPRIIAFGQDWPAQLAGTAVEQRPLPSALPPAAWLAGQVDTVDAERCNLLQGEFAPRIRRGRTVPRTRLAALAFAAVALLLAAALVEHAWLASERERLAGRVDQRLQGLFPEEARWVRPEAQAARRLAALRGGGEDGLMRGLAAVAPLLQGLDGVQLQALEYRPDQGLQLDLEARELADIEALARQLRGARQLVAVGDVAVRDGRTRARLSVRPEGGS
ncbi:MAG: type II secretion system protein GspL [Wenzhouxiangellaceae bacterium]|nr:type II secretion system protein GspL [Wenzhouxiangellaceae bacterium]